MFLFAIPILLAVAVEAKKVNVRSYEPHSLFSAASDAQIRFAIENKYDDTGPGSKEPEYAYKTFKNLEDALVAYLDDPDTKLPDHERAKAYQQLLNKPIGKDYTLFSNQKRPQFQRFYPKSVEEYVGLKPLSQSQMTDNPFYSGPTISNLDFGIESNGVELLKELERDRETVTKPYKSFLKYKPGNDEFVNLNLKPTSLDHYLGTQEDVTESLDPFNPNPQYTFSYGVHDKKTGDSKAAHETRDGNVVRGYYTFMDADGKQRTVHYTADDKEGFRATVQRTPTNSQ